MTDSPGARAFQASETRALTLAAAVDRAIRDHGQQTYPHECCGALVGRGDRVSTAVALENTTEEGPRRRFLVRPSGYRESERRATELGRTYLRRLAAA